MGIREDERRWKRIHDALAAEANGKTLRPVVSQRTLFGIPSTVEQQIERVVAEDEAARKIARQREATGQSLELGQLPEAERTPELGHLPETEQSPES